MYSVYDVKGLRYDTPFFANDDLYAKRHFTMMIQKIDTMVGMFKDDFELVKLGSFDVETGKAVNIEPDTILQGKQIEIQK